jgi:hypothetical protein
MTDIQPIEEGWRIMERRLHDGMPPEVKEVLRFMFFAGARHYRAIVKRMFDIQDDNREQILVDLAAEIHKWESGGMTLKDIFKDSDKPH